MKLTQVSIRGILINTLLDTGASCSLIRESIARQLGCHFTPISKNLKGIGQDKLHVFAVITVPVQFKEICLELDIYVARDSNFYHDLIIGINAVEFPDVEIITDSCGSRLVRKSNLEKTQELNIISTLPEPFELNIGHLSNELQEKVKKKTFSKNTHLF